MGVYNTYVASKMGLVSEAEEIKFDTPDSSFAGIMETVCQIHEMDQKVFDSLLELDMMEIFSEADETATDSAEEKKEDDAKKEPGKIKKLLQAIKTIIAKAIDSIKKAVSNIITKIQQAKNDKIKAYADDIIKSPKLKDFKIAEFRTPKYNGQYGLRAAKLYINAAYSSFDSLRANFFGQISKAADATAINAAKTQAKEDFKKALKTREDVADGDTLFAIQKDRTFVPANITFYADLLSTTKHEEIQNVKKIANDNVAKIKQAEQDFVKANNANNKSDLKEAVAEAAYAISSETVKNYLKLQQISIDMVIQEFKNARAVLVGAYKFCKGGEKADNKKKETKDEATQETVDYVSELGVTNVMEASDLYMDALMLV